jgi:hypothetical protein
MQRTWKINDYFAIRTEHPTGVFWFGQRCRDITQSLLALGTGVVLWFTTQLCSSGRITRKSRAECVFFALGGVGLILA